MGTRAELAGGRDEMACDCIRLMDEALRSENLRLDCAHWFSRETGRYRTTVRIGTELIEKKRGQRPSTMIPDFCPFCGVRYEADAALAGGEGQG